MEQNMPIVAKKFWKIVRVVYFMLRKGISKAKLLADLDMMMKRSKIAGKAAIHNPVFHHHPADAAFSSSDRRLSFPVPVNEYEFSCRDSPVYDSGFHLPFHLNKRKRPPVDSEMAAAALEMVDNLAASPALPEFGRSPAVRQLRVTDSPFQLRDNGDEDNHVDEAAEEFIKRFYKDLKRQNAMANCSDYSELI